MRTLWVKAQILAVFIALPASAQYFSSPLNHRIRIFNQGVAALEQRLQMIEHAKHTIDVEYYVFDDKEISARLLSQALVRKARAGVQVRMLIDHLSLVLKVDSFLAAEFARNHIKVRYFNPSSLFSTLGQHRNHRKHVIVDGDYPELQQDMTGSRNMEDKYFDLDPRYNFLDRDVWVQGPIVAKVKQTFDELWLDPVSQDPALPAVPHPVPNPAPAHGMNMPQYDADLRRYNERSATVREFLTANAADAAARAYIASVAAQQRSKVGVFASPVTFIADHAIGHDPLNDDNKDQTIWKNLEYALNHAETSILAQTPYLILEKDAFADVAKLRARNVTVDALTNSPFSTDSELVATTFYGISSEIARSGAIVHVYNGQPPEFYGNTMPGVSRHARWGIHAKTMVFDSRSTAIGSFNLDPRSKNLNLESVMYFPDNREIARFVSQSIREEEKQSYEFFQFNSETGKVSKRFSDCKDMSFFQCFMFRVQRPLGFFFQGLL